MAMFVVLAFLLVENASPTGGGASAHSLVQDLKKLQAENEDQPRLSTVLPCSRLKLVSTLTT